MVQLVNLVVYTDLGRGGLTHSLILSGTLTHLLTTVFIEQPLEKPVGLHCITDLISNEQSNKDKDEDKRNIEE